MPDRTYLKSNIHMYGVPSTSQVELIPLFSMTWQWQTSLQVRVSTESWHMQLFELENIWSLCCRTVHCTKSYCTLHLTSTCWSVSPHHPSPDLYKFPLLNNRLSRHWLRVFLGRNRIHRYSDSQTWCLPRFSRSSRNLGYPSVSPQCRHHQYCVLVHRVKNPVSVLPTVKVLYPQSPTYCIVV